MFVHMNLPVKIKQERLINMIRVTLLVATLLCVGVQLFVNPYVGLANNGDFQRLSKKVGLDYFEDPWLAENYDDSFWHYMIPTFSVTEPTDTGFYSSAEPLLRGAKVLNQLFSYDTSVFDIRWLGFVYFLLYALAIILMFWHLKGSSLVITFLGGISFFFFFTDINHIVYFNTFYGEAPSYVFLVLLFAFSFSFLRSKSLKAMSTFFVGELICVSLFLTAKYQNILAVIGFCFLLSLQLVHLLKQFKLPKLRSIRVISVICLNLALIIPSTLSVTESGGGNTVTTANVILQEILLVSEDPGKMLSAGGFTEEEKLIIKPYIGSYMFVPDISTELTQMFLNSSKINRNVELKMLLSEPLSICRLIALKSQYLFSFPKYGTVKQSYGLPAYYFDQRFSLYSNVFQSLMPSHWLFYILVISMICIYAIWRIYQNRDCSTFLFYHILLSLCIISVGLAVTVVFGDSHIGSDNGYKQFYITNETFYLAMSLSIWDFIRCLVFKRATIKQ